MLIGHISWNIPPHFYAGHRGGSLHAGRLLKKKKHFIWKASPTIRQSEMVAQVIDAGDRVLQDNLVYALSSTQ